MNPSNGQTLSWAIYTEGVTYGSQSRIYLLEKVDFDKFEFNVVLIQSISLFHNI